MDSPYWRGRMSNADPHDLPPGAMVLQDNAISIAPGELRSRMGTRVFTFGADETVQNADVIAVCTYLVVHTGNEHILYELSNGEIRGSGSVGLADYSIRKGCARIKQGLNPAQPMCFCKDRQGYLVGVNGLDRGILWNGVTSYVYKLGVDAPTVDPTIVLSSGGALEAGDYLYAYRYVDVLGRPSNISTLVRKTATAGQKSYWSFTVPPAATPPDLQRIDKIELWRTLVNEAVTLYRVASLAITETNYTDTLSDDDLQDAASDDPSLALNIVNQDGSPSARRFVPPPDFKAVVVPFQERFFYGVDATYHQDERNKIYYSEPDEIESVPRTNVIKVPDLPGGEEDEVSALIPGPHSLYVAKGRSIYSLNYVVQPKIDARITLTANRGCLNQRCWVNHEGVIYSADQWGVWRFSGEGGVDPISTPIQDIFRNGVMNWALRNWFFMALDPRLEVVYLFYCDKASGETRAGHALAYHVRTGQWSTESYPWTFSGSTLIHIADGSLQLALGGNYDAIFCKNYGYLDGTLGNGTTRGTIDSATATDFVDQDAVFPTDAVGAPVKIVKGTGKGQTATIGVISGNQLFHTGFDVIPDTTSVYQIGAITCATKTGKRRLARKKDGQEAGVLTARSVRLAFAPTTSDALLNMRLWFNHETAPRNMTAAIDLGTNITTQYGSPDIEINLASTINEFGIQPGVTRVELDERVDDRSMGDRWIQVELAWDQGAVPVSIFDLSVEGVE